MNITESELGTLAFLCCFYSNDDVAVWNNDTVINKSFFIFLRRRASAIMTLHVVNECASAKPDYQHIFLSPYQEMLYTCTQGVSRL